MRVKDIRGVEFVFSVLITYLIELFVVEFFNVFEGHWLVHDHIFYFLLFLGLSFGGSGPLLLFLDLGGQSLVVCCLRNLLLFFLQLLLLVSDCLVVLWVAEEVQGVLLLDVLADGEAPDRNLLQ